MNQTFKVLASGSSGNCYALTVGEETLLLECGIAWKDILKGLDFNIKNVIGCLITHEHKDHSKAVVNVIKNGIDIYTSTGTLEALGIEKNYRIHSVKEKKAFNVGNFKIMAFKVKHDTAEPFGYLISNKGVGNILFVTDSASIEYEFIDLSNIFIECNHWGDSENLDNRILKTHMSLVTCKGFIRDHTSNVLNNVVLLHLSDRNSDEILFKEEIERVCGVPVYIANKNLEIELGGIYE